MEFKKETALQLLRTGTRLPDAAFREGQEEAIRHIVEGKGRLLVVQKTGWGKSFVYFIAIKLLRETGAGPALLISPLLALMRNQIAAAERMGVCAATINSDNMDDWTAVERKLARREIDILLISPERLANERFRSQVLARIERRSLCWSSTKRTAFPTGGTTSVPITGCWNASSGHCRQISGSSPLRRQRTTG